MANLVYPVTGYDAVTPGNIPADADVVFGYCDGDYAWKPEDWARFATPYKIPVTVLGNLRATVADCENGDMTPASVANWIVRKQAEHLPPATVYCSLTMRPAVVDACRGEAYYWWAADWTNSPHHLPGSVATQYEDDQNRYDLTAIYDEAWLEACAAAARRFFA